MGIINYYHWFDVHAKGALAFGEMHSTTLESMKSDDKRRYVLVDCEGVLREGGRKVSAAGEISERVRTLPWLKRSQEGTLSPLQSILVRNPETEFTLRFFKGTRASPILIAPYQVDV